MSVTQQLQEIVESVARSCALTPDAIRQFDEQRRRTQQLESDLEIMKKERDNVQTERIKVGEELRSARAQIEVLTARATAAEKRNAEADKALWIADFEKDRRAEMRSILNDIFRNAEISRYIMANVSHVIPPQYSGGVPTLHTATDSRTETETRK